MNYAQDPTPSCVTSFISRFWCKLLWKADERCTWVKKNANLTDSHESFHNFCPAGDAINYWPLKSIICVLTNALHNSSASSLHTVSHNTSLSCYAYHLLGYASTNFNCVHLAGSHIELNTSYFEHVHQWDLAFCAKYLSSPSLASWLISSWLSSWIMYLRFLVLAWKRSVLLIKIWYQSILSDAWFHPCHALHWWSCIFLHMLEVWTLRI